MTSDSNTRSGANGPLHGIKVVDLTRVLAGPYCTMLLLDMGAQVIKVEPPEVGDDARHFGPFMHGQSAYFASLNRGKKSIALNLKSAPDRSIFEQILNEADVLVENYRGGTMEKLGYGYADLKHKYPRLIYAACSGFGHTGPYKTRAAYDMVVQAMGGVISLTGYPGGPPTRVGTSVGDLCAAMFTTVGINAALYAREQSGHGTKIDVSMLDSQVAFLENAIARYYAIGEIPGPLGARHPSITPFEAYEAANGYFIIAAGNDGLFKKLCDTIGRSELCTDARFENNAKRNENVADLKIELEAALKQKPVAHWLDELESAGVPCGAINNVEQVLNDPQVQHRNMVVSCDDPVMGDLRMAGNPIKFADHPDPSSRASVPMLDGDRAAILASLAAANDG